MPRNRRGLADLMAETVLVTLKTGTAFEGVVWAASATHIVLRDARQIASGGARTPPADGEVWLERVNVDYVQRPTPGPRS